MDRSPLGRANESERINRSTCRAYSPLVLFAPSHSKLRSRRESNPHLRFRKPPFYPLNYGNKLRFFLVVSPVCVTLIACNGCKGWKTGGFTALQKGGTESLSRRGWPLLSSRQKKRQA